MENQPRARRELMDWLKADFKCAVDRIEDCCSGAIYLLIIDRLYPNKVPLTKVNWTGATEYDMLKNFKLLQEVFKTLGIRKGFNIDNLIKRKYPDHLEMLQWFYNLYEKRIRDVPGPYDPTAWRKTCNQPLPPWATKTLTSGVSAPGGFSHMSHANSHVSLAARPRPTSQITSGLPVKREKDKLAFYESKLKSIAAVCSHSEDPEYIDKRVIEFILQCKDTIELDV